MGISIGSLYACREFVIPGKTLLQLIPTGIVFALLYAAIGFRFVVEPEHRQFVLTKAASRWNRFRARDAAGA
jgi:hypothetical protein